MAVAATYAFSKRIDAPFEIGNNGLMDLVLIVHSNMEWILDGLSNGRHDI